LFANSGEVKGVKIVTARNKDDAKSYGFIDFSDHQGVLNAL